MIFGCCFLQRISGRNEPICLVSLCIKWASRSASGQKNAKHGSMKTELRHPRTISLGNVPVFVRKQWRRSRLVNSARPLSFLFSFLSEPTATLLVQKNDQGICPYSDSTRQSEQSYTFKRALTMKFRTFGLEIMFPPVYTGVRHDKHAGQQPEYWHTMFDGFCHMHRT